MAYMHNSTMIVFEGPECGGKTTAAMKMADKYTARIVKGVRIPDRFHFLNSTVEDIKQQLIRTRLGGERLVIYDRWTLISDIVYEKYVYGRNSIIEPILPDLVTPCMRANILIVYVTISEEEMVKRFSARGDKVRTLDEAIITRNAYERFFEKCPLPHIRIDATNMTTEEIIQAVEAKL